MYVVDALGVLFGLDIDPPNGPELRRLLEPLRVEGDADVLLRMEGGVVTQDGERIGTFDPTAEVLGYLVSTINRTAIERTDRLVLHAGAVVHKGRAILIAAPQQHGKSTLTAALVMAGCDYLTDEAPSFTAESALVHPYPKPFALSAHSLHLLGLPERPAVEPADRQVAASELRQGCLGAAAPLGAVVFPSLGDVHGPVIEEIERSRAVMHLAEHTFGLRTAGAQAVRELERVTRGARSCQLTVGDPHETARALLNWMERSPL